MHDFMSAFRQLSRGSRQALLLSKIEGRSYGQIASQAGIAIGTVKSRISRGRASLERLLNPEPASLADAHPKHTSRRTIQSLAS